VRARVQAGQGMAEKMSQVCPERPAQNSLHDRVCKNCVSRENYQEFCTIFGEKLQQTTLSANTFVRSFGGQFSRFLGLDLSLVNLFGRLASAAARQHWGCL